MKDFTCEAPYQRTEEYKSMIGAWSVKVIPETTGGPLWRMGMMAEVEAWMQANGVQAVVHGDNIFTSTKENAFLLYLAFR